MKTVVKQKKLPISRSVTPVTLSVVIDATNNLAIVQWNPNGTVGGVQDAKTKFGDAVKTAIGQK